MGGEGVIRLLEQLLVFLQLRQHRVPPMGGREINRTFAEEVMREEISPLLRSQKGHGDLVRHLCEKVELFDKVAHRLLELFGLVRIEDFVAFITRPRRLLSPPYLFSADRKQVELHQRIHDPMLQALCEIERKPVVGKNFLYMLDMLALRFPLSPIGSTRCAGGNSFQSDPEPSCHGRKVLQVVQVVA